MSETTSGKIFEEVGLKRCCENHAQGLLVCGSDTDSRRHQLQTSLLTSGLKRMNVAKKHVKTDKHLMSEELH